MNFEQRSFLVLVLPLTGLLFSVFPKLRKEILIAVSVYLVTSAGVVDLGVLIFSVVFNFAFSHWVFKFSQVENRIFLFGIILANVIFLFSAKLSFFQPGAGLIPIGISFYTFQQIGYHLDSYKFKTQPPSLKDYTLIITFFPHLAAGPIVRFQDILRQVQEREWKERTINLIPANWVLLMIGLSKKIFIADHLSPWVSDAFASALRPTEVLQLTHLLLCTVGYGLQIYFDFSGYSDIAVALGLIFGIELPINFDSPFKSKSIIEFWRRWHISLSTFIRTYLYAPLRTFFPVLSIILIMIVVGLWHGLSWMFLLWGLSHGGLIVLNHFWRRTRFRLPSWVSWALTLISTSLLWPLFRNLDLKALSRIYSAWQTPILSSSLIGVLGVPSLMVLFCPNSMTLYHWTRIHFCALESSPKWITYALHAALIGFGVLLILFSDFQQEFIYSHF